MLMMLMTGLSGAGKTTLADALKVKLVAMGLQAEVIDGDMYRKTINRDLGFSAEDRRENINRLTRLAYEKMGKGSIVIVAAIAPFDDQRLEIKKEMGTSIIWIKCTLAKLMERDTKGLYKKALLPDDHPGKLWNLSGINDPYELPQHANLVIDTTESTIDVSVHQLLQYVLSQLSFSKPA